MPIVQDGWGRDGDRDDNDDVSGDVRNPWVKGDFRVTCERGERTTTCPKVNIIFVKSAFDEIFYLGILNIFLSNVTAYLQSMCFAVCTQIQTILVP